MFGGSLPSKTPQLKADTRDVENPSIFPHLPRPSQACSEHASHWERKREKEIQMEVQQKAAKVIFGCFQK